jgi:uncharacterized OB-fold protein
MSVRVDAPPVREGLFDIESAALLAGSCAECGALHFPRRGLCPECQSAEIETLPMSGGGQIYTYTVLRMTPPGYAGEVPYAIGVVELTEPLRVTATLLADDIEELAIGDRVEFELLMLGEDEPVLSYAYRKVER